MSNSLVQEYRRRVPNDSRSDAEITYLLGQQHEQDGSFDQFPDFVDDYQKIKIERRDALAPSLGGEFKQGVASGVASLGSTVAGAGTLAVDAAAKYAWLPEGIRKPVHDYLMGKVKGFEETAQENAPTIPSYKDIRSPADAVRYGAYGAGNVVPSLAEAATTSAIGAGVGAALGSEVPGAGTVAGATGGAVAGLIERQAIKSLIKKGIGKLVSSEAAPLVEKELGEIAAGRLTRATAQTAAKDLLAKESKDMAARYGGNIATALNSYALSSGEIYNDLVTDPSVDPDKALNVSLLGGLVGGAPDTILPSYVMSRFFKGAQGEAAKSAKNKFYSFLTHMASDAAKEIPGEALTEGFQEFVDIAAQHYAQGKGIPTKLSDAEKERIINSAAFGAIGGGFAAPISAIGSSSSHPTIKQYTGEVTDKAKSELLNLAAKDLAGDLTETDRATIQALSTEKKNAFTLLKEQIAQKGTQTTSQPTGDVSSDLFDGALPKNLKEVTPNGEEQKQAEEERVLTPNQNTTPATASTQAQGVIENNNNPPAATTPASPGITPLQQKAREMATKVREAEADTNTKPTEAQKEQGNYAKGRVNLHGLDIAIENPKGSERSGKDADGKEWRVTLPATYGYLERTEAKDGDALDVYIGDNPASEKVFVVDQVDAATGKFDETKSMLGFNSQDEALKAYDAAFSDGKGPQRRGAVTEMSMGNFKKWVKEGDTKKPVGALAKSDAGNPISQTAPPIKKPDRNNLDKDARLARLQTRFSGGRLLENNLDKSKSPEEHVKALVSRTLGTEDKATISKFSQGLVYSGFGSDVWHQGIFNLWDEANKRYEQSQQTTPPVAKPEVPAQTPANAPEAAPNGTGSASPTQPAPAAAGPVPVAPAPTVAQNNGATEAPAKSNGTAPSSAPEGEAKPTRKQEVEKELAGLYEKFKATPDDPEVLGKIEKLEAESKALGEAAKEEVAAPKIVEKTKEAPKEEKESKPFLNEEEQAEADAIWKELADLGSNTNTGVNPKYAVLGTKLAGLYLKAGLRNIGESFAAFSRDLVAKLGDVVRPYLKEWFAAAAFERVNDMDGADLTKELKRLGLTKEIGSNPILGEDSKHAEENLPRSAYHRRLQAIALIMDKIGMQMEPKEESSATVKEGVITPEQIDFDNSSLASEGSRLGGVRLTLTNAEEHTQALLQQHNLGPKEEALVREALDRFSQASNKEQALEDLKTVWRDVMSRDMEPPFFEISAKDLKDPKFADRLESGARSPNKTDPYQISRRVVALKDNQTGKVNLVSAFREQTTKTVSVADPERTEGFKRNARLSEVLSRKTADGKPRYTPLSSARLTVLKNAANQEFDSVAAYEKHFAGPARDQMAAAKSRAEAVAAKFAEPFQGQTAPAEETAGSDEEATPEDTDSEVKTVRGRTDESGEFDHLLQGDDEETTAPEVVDTEASEQFNLPRVFSEKHANALFQIFGIGRLTPKRFETLFDRIYETRLGVDSIVYPTAWLMHHGLDQQTATEAVQRIIYEIFTNPASSEGGKAGYVKALEASLSPVQLRQVAGGLREAGQLQASATQERSGAAQGSQPSTPAAPTTGSGQANPEGLTPPGRGAEGGPDSANDTRYSVPAGNAESLDSSPHFRDIVDVLRSAGIPVDLHQQVYQNLIEEFVQNGQVTGSVTGGMYNRAVRAVSMVLRDVSNPSQSDLRVLFEEATHALFDQEGQGRQQSILEAVSQATDEQLGLSAQGAEDIANAYPNGAAKPVLAEERLARAISDNLINKGFNAAEAGGIGRSIVRFVKDFYYKALMKLQTTLLGQQFSSPELVSKYLQNRMEAFLARDSASVGSFVERLTGGVVKQSTIGSWYSDNPLFERAGPRGIEYQPIPLTDPAAVRFSVPAVDTPTRTVELEKLAATLNHQVLLIGKVSEHPELAALAKEAKLDPYKFVLKILNLSDPLEGLAVLENEKESDGQPVQFDKTKLIEDFNHPAQIGATRESAYLTTSRTLDKAGQIASEAPLIAEKAEREKSELMQDYVVAKENYANSQFQVNEAVKDIQAKIKDIFASIQGESKKRGAIEQQLREVDPSAVLKQYGPVFQKLFTGDQLKGERLYKILDTVANDDAIDFTQGIREIKKAMEGEPGYGMFLEKTPESKALLATVVAFAKTNARVMVNFELRRMSDGKAREAIIKSIDALQAEKNELVKDEPRALARTATIAERARAAYRTSLQEVRSADRRSRRAQTQAKVANLVVPIYYKAKAELESHIGLGADFTWSDGAAYNVPLTADMSSEDVLKSTKKLALDTSSGNVSSPTEIEADIRRMTDFIQKRDEMHESGDATAHDYAYNTIKRQRDALTAHKNFIPGLEPASRLVAERFMLATGTAVHDSFGTPSAQSIRQRVNRFTAEHLASRPQAEKIWRKTQRLEDDLMRMLPRVGSNKREWLQTNILNPAKRLMQNQHDLEEAYPKDPDKLRRAIFARVQRHVLQTNTVVKHALIASKADTGKFMHVLEKLLNHQDESNAFWLQQIKQSGLGVQDDRLGGIRNHRPVGEFTFSQKLSNKFAGMVNSLNKSGWATATDEFAKIAEQWQNPDQVKDLAGKYFSNIEHGSKILSEFLRPVVEMQVSPFEILQADENTTIPADPAKVREAFDRTGGDPVEFAVALGKLSGVPEAQMGQHVQNTMLKLSSIYDEVASMQRKLEGTNSPITGIRGMTSDFMINARRVEHLPGEWFTYHTFDQQDTSKIAERIAAQIAFGRGNEGLASDFDTLKNEVNQAKLKMDSAMDEAREENPDADQKKIEKLAQQKLDSLQPGQYKRLKSVVDNGAVADKALRGFSDYFRKHNSPDANFRFGIQVAHTLASLLVNQISSAIAQLAAVVDTMFRFGVSGTTLKATGDILLGTGKEIAASFGQALGIEMLNDSAYHKKYVELKLGDAGVTHRFRDVFDRQQGESAASYALRAVREVTGTGFNRLGEKAQHTVLRPAQLFTSSAIAVNKAITEGTWKMVSGMVGDGVAYYRDHPADLANPNFKLTKEALKLSGFGGNTFTRVTSEMMNYGLNYDDMVRGALKRGDTSLTNNEARMIHAMAMSEVSSESNLSTMPVGAYNNSIIRFGVPLLGWSFRRAGQIAGLRLDENGKNSLRFFGYGMAGLGAIALGGMGMSLLLDDYYEKLLAKKRNLRPMTSPEGLLENLNRVGTFGLFGELASSVINVGQGGDNRMLSVDQRVVAMASFQSLLRGVQSFINQDFNADYAHVIRPIAQAVGGGGLMQYLQLANNALGLDNEEARMTARLNAQNWLRVAGRELEMEVRAGGGGYSTPTPLTPHLTKMELAAYANNPADFQEAYREALQEAQEAGKPDPKDYVKRAFETRNPLRSVFRQAPTAHDYNQILSALPDSGAQDVSEAVRLFNAYGQSIGVAPFEGRHEKGATSASKTKDKTDNAIKLPRLTLDQARRLSLPAEAR